MKQTDFAQLTVRVDQLEANLAENTASTKRVEESTSEMVEFFRSVQGAFKVLGWIGKLARPIGYIAAALGAIAGMWASIKGVK